MTRDASYYFKLGRARARKTPPGGYGLRVAGAWEGRRPTCRAPIQAVDARERYGVRASNLRVDSNQARQSPNYERQAERNALLGRYSVS